MSVIDHDFEFMQYALALADEAEHQGEVPVGAVIVHQGRIVGSGFNQPISATDCTAHAEIIALRAACEEQNNYRLSDCDMYVTLEPCAMCAGAIVHARIRRLIFAASDPKTGACGSVFDVVSNNPTGHRVEITAGVEAEAATAKIQDFFKRRRAEKKQQKTTGG
jgi:tRNA(adenine34) deaminase